MRSRRTTGCYRAAAARIARAAARGSAAWKIALPATRMSAPAARAAVVGSMPPSISISNGRSRDRRISGGRPPCQVLGDERLAAEPRRDRHHEQQVDPSSRYGLHRRRTGSARRDDPPRMPSARMRSSSGGGSPSSTCTCRGRRRPWRASSENPGLVTIRWQSRNRSVCRRSDATTGGPIDEVRYEVTVHEVDVEPVGLAARPAIIRRGRRSRPTGSTA